MSAREWKPSPIDQRRADLYDVTMDGHLDAGLPIPQAHALALQAVIEAEQDDARRITSQIIPKEDAWPFGP